MERSKDSKLFLKLQLFDGATNKYPRARTYDANGVFVEQLDLTHVAGGLYSESTGTMPDTPMLTAKFVVYSDSGHTTEDTSYQQTIELVDLIEETSTLPDSEIVAEVFDHDVLDT